MMTNILKRILLSILIVSPFLNIQAVKADLTPVATKLRTEVSKAKLKETSTLIKEKSKTRFIGNSTEGFYRIQHNNVNEIITKKVIKH